LIRNAAEQQLQNAQQEAQNMKLLSVALNRRDFDERKAALNLAQMALSGCDLDLGISQLDKLVNALEVSFTSHFAMNSLLIKVGGSTSGSRCSDCSE